MRKPLIFLFLFALATTGCQKKTVDTLNRPLVTKDKAYSAMRRADTAARAQRTARIYTRVQVEAEGKPYVLFGSGWTDFRTRRTDFIFDYGVAFDGTENGPKQFRLISTEKTVYLCLPDAKGTCKRWGALDRQTGEALLNTVVGSQGYVDPADSFLPLLGVRNELDFVGTQRLKIEEPFASLQSHSNVDASEFHTTIDPNEALKRAPDTRSLSARKLLGNVGELLPVSVWVGADGLVYRYAITFGVGTAATRSMVQFYDYGNAPRVDIPSGAKVFRTAEEIGAFFNIGGAGGQTGGSSSGEFSGGGSSGGSPSPAPSTSASFGATGSAGPTPAPS